MLQELGCLCNDIADNRLECPWHTAFDYWESLKHRFADEEGSPDPYLPVFPDVCGHVLPKHAMVSAIESLAAQAGEILVNEAGCRRFGGHTPRVSGSRFWASQGLELFKIQILARWGSAMVLRYVAEAPLQAITTDIKKRMSVHKVWDAISELDKTLSEVLLKQSRRAGPKSHRRKGVSNKRPS